MQRDIVGPADAKLLASFRGDSTLAAIVTRTPAEIDAWVDANVTTVADARRLFKLILRLVVILARKELNG